MENKGHLAASVHLARTELPEKEESLDNEGVPASVVLTLNIVLVLHAMALQYFIALPHRSKNTVTAVCINGIYEVA